MSLQAVDTQPIPLNGETTTVTRDIALALPDRVVAPSVSTVRVTIHIEPVMETRTFSAGIELVGAVSDRTYELSTTRVLVTLFGPVRDLDAIADRPLVARLDVGGLEPGPHIIQAQPVVPSGLTVADTSPPTVTVTVVANAPSQSPGAAPGASPSASISPAP